MNEPLDLKYLTGLHHILARRFDEGELRTLCFNLGINYDDLPGQGNVNKARELIAYLDRRNRLSDLIETGKQVRPDISWSNAPDQSDADLSVEVQEFKNDFDGYYCNLRIFNRLPISRTAILTKLFLEVERCRAYDVMIPKFFAGAPIGGVKIAERIHIPPKPGKWLLLDEHRKYPPNEVEDISFRFTIAESWQYLIRFGLTWYAIGDKAQQRSYSLLHYIIGEPGTDRSDQDEYNPPDSFVDPPRLLEKDEWPA